MLLAQARRDGESPSRPARARAPRHVAKLIVPQRDSTVTSAENAAGTPAARMPWSGTSSRPRARNASGVAFIGAAMLPFTAITRDSPARRSRIGHSPPMRVHLRVHHAFDQRRRHRGVDRVAAGLQHVDAGVDREIGVGSDRAVRADEARIEGRRVGREKPDRIVCSCPWKSVCAPSSIEQTRVRSMRVATQSGDARCGMIADSPGLCNPGLCSQQVRERAY